MHPLQPQDPDLPHPHPESHLPGLRLQPAARAALPEGGGRDGGGGGGGQPPAGGFKGETSILVFAVAGLQGKGGRGVNTAGEKVVGVWGGGGS